MDRSAIFLSLRLAASTALILLLFGMPLAFWLAQSRSKWKFAIEAIVSLPLVLPPTVLGFYVLLAISPTSRVGSLYRDWTGTTLPFSFAGLLVGSILYSLPFAIQPFTAAITAVDRVQIETAWSLGASRLETFFRIILPLSFPGILTGVILSFAHTLGEFGLVMMIGGNIPGVTRTISVSIYDSVQELDYGTAGRSALLLLIVSLLVLTLVNFLRGRSLRKWQPL